MSQNNPTPFDQNRPGTNPPQQHPGYSHFGHQGGPIPQPPRSGNPLVVVAIVFGVLLGILGMMGVLVYFAISAIPDLGNNNRDASIAASADWDEPEQDKFEKANVAFSGMPLEQHADLESISAFLSELSEFADQTGSDDLKALLDLNKYVREMRHSGFLSGMANLSSTSDLRDIAEGRVLGPVSFEQFYIYKIDEAESGADERVVYAITNDSDFVCMPQRFWLAKNNGAWKLYDWEPMDYGVRDSYETACLVGNRISDEAYNAYSDYIDISNDYDRDMASDTGPIDYALNENRLERITALPFPDYLLGELILDISYRWEDIGDLEGEQKCLQRVPYPDRTPGILFEMSSNEFDSGNYGKSLAYIERYEKAVGKLEKSRQVVVNCYSELHNTEKELETRLELARRFPESYSMTTHLSRVIVDGTETQISEALAIADAQEDSAPTYISLISNFENRYGITTNLNLLDEHLKETQPDSAIARRASFAVLEAVGETEQVLQAMLENVKADPTDPDALYELLSFAIDEKKLKDLATELDPVASFEQIVMLADDIGVASGDVNVFAQRVLESDPDDVTANYYAGTYYSEQEQFSEAIPFLERAARDLEDGEDDSGYGEYATSVLARCRYETLGFDEVIRLYKDDEDLTDYLMYFLMDERNFVGAAKFLESSSIDFESRLGVEARVAFETGDSAQAIRLIQQMQRADDFDPHGYSYSLNQSVEIAMDIAVKDGNVLKAVEILPIEQVTTKVLAELNARGDQEGLSKLKDMVQTIPGIKLLSEQIEIDRLWNLGKYDELVALAEDRNLAEMEVDDDDNLQSSRLDKLVRAAIRAGVTADHARMLNRIAERADSELGDNELKLLLAIHREDEKEYKRLFAGNYYSELFLGDPDVPMELLAKARNEQIAKERTSVPAYTSGDESTVTILLSDLIPLDTNAVKSKLAAAGFGSLQVEQLADQATNTSAWLATGEYMTVALAIRPRNPADPNAAVSRNKVVEIAESHSHLLYVNVEYAPYRGDTSEATAIEIAAAFDNDSCLALCDGYSTLLWNDVLQVIEKRKSDFGAQARSSWENLGRAETYYLDSDEFAFDGQRAFAAKLLDAVEQFRQKPAASSLVVGVVGWRGEAREIMNVKIDSVHFDQYGQPEFKGAVVDDSRLFPAVIRSLPVEVYMYGIRRFEFTSGESTVTEEFIGSDS